jgi:hypothetical protein
VVNPTSQRQSRPHDQPTDHPMTAPSVPGPALAWVRASDDTNTRARPAVEQFDPSQNVYPRITRRDVPVRRVGGVRDRLDRSPSANCRERGSTARLGRVPRLSEGLLGQCVGLGEGRCTAHSGSALPALMVATSPFPPSRTRTCATSSARVPGLVHDLTVQAS